MAQDGNHIILEDFRVLTRRVANGRSQDAASPAPLHPKVREYLQARRNVLRFQIHDGFYASFNVYGMDHLKQRKIFYVDYSLINEPDLRTGPGVCMIFDQATGELLYHGEDGGE